VGRKKNKGEAVPTPVQLWSKHDLFRWSRELTHGSPRDKDAEEELAAALNEDQMVVHVGQYLVAGKLGGGSDKMSRIKRAIRRRKGEVDIGLTAEDKAYWMSRQQRKASQDVDAFRKRLASMDLQAKHEELAERNAQLQATADEHLTPLQRAKRARELATAKREALEKRQRETRNLRAAAAGRRFGGGGSGGYHFDYERPVEAPRNT